jgi:uncharacterized protein YijF (DUF1287 family)
MAKFTARFTRLNERARTLLAVGAALTLIALAAGALPRDPSLAARLSPGAADTLRGETQYAGARGGAPTESERDGLNQKYYGEEGQFVTQARAMIGRKVEWDSGRDKLAANQDLVCTDIAMIAVQQSGIDIREQMAEDYYKNRKKLREYDHGDLVLRIKRFIGGYNNQPKTAQFYRRIQNVVTYQINQGLYYRPDDPNFTPQAGMLIVYDLNNLRTGKIEREYHSGVISAVKDGEVTRVILATSKTNPPSVQEYAEAELDLLDKRGFTVNGYGAWPVP